MINAIIMAAGYGRRMGEDKLLMPFRGKMLFEHIIEKVAACDFYDKVIISRDERILEAAVKKGVKAVKNDGAFKGQSESIKLGIKSTVNSDGYMFFTADQPLIDVKTIESLMAFFNKNRNNIIIPRFKGTIGNPIIFPGKFVKELMALEDDVGGRNVINKHPEDVKFVEIQNEYALKDIDTYEDYKKILEVKE